MSEYQKALEDLNREYLDLYYSDEYRSGRKRMIVKYYLRNFKFITLIKKIMNSIGKKNNSIKNNYENPQIFKNNWHGAANNYGGEKVAVYSVNIGGYDNLVQPIYRSHNLDYYYISDKKPEDLGVWKWIDAKKYTQGLKLSNVKKARFLKLHPDILFPNYKYSIFIDGNIRAVGDLSALVNKINKNTKIAIHLHPYRNCIYDEAICCKRSGKGDPKIIDEQVGFYMKDGMPKKYGLFETNIIVREHNDATCKNIMKQWWEEISKWSERDQLSFTYVLWKNNFVSNDIGVLGDNPRENILIQVLDHKDEYRKK